MPRVVQIGPMWQRPLSMAVQQFPYAFTAGDRYPQINGALANTDISGWTITLVMQRPDPNPLLTISATISDGPGGVFTFPWGAGDLVEGFGQLTEVKMVNGAGLLQTSAQFTVDVEASL